MPKRTATAVAVLACAGASAQAAMAQSLPSEQPPPVAQPPAAPSLDVDPAPPVRQRLWVAAPRRARSGRAVRVAVRRRGDAGRYEARLCVAPPALGWDCRTLVSATACAGSRRASR